MSDVQEEPVTRAAIYISTYPFPMADCPSPQVTPLETQEQACRAYCDRIGYEVVRVYRGTSPTAEALWMAEHWSRRGEVPDPADLPVTPQTPHPYDEVWRLYGEGAVDVVIEFIASGPSGDA